MKSLRLRCVAVLCAVAAAGTAARSQNRAGKSKAAKAESLPGFDLASLDRSASACQDFNQFANGGWSATR